MSFEREEEAFRAYVKTFPANSVLLVDTYDTVEGIKKAIEVAKELKAKGFTLKGVRLDSGDVVELAKVARELLDSAGFKEAKIVVSGGLDEYRIDEILKAGAPVDAFGVGTKVGTSADSPYIDFVYKLVELDGKPVMKTSTGKKMYPGRKQVFRKEGSDTVALSDEKLVGTPLIELVIKEGRVVKELPSPQEIRDYFLEEFSKFPEELKDIHTSFRYPVLISEKLEGLYKELKDKLLGR